MTNPESDAVDVWILGFDLPAEDAAEGIAWAFEMDLARATALVASAPRAVRRGVAAEEAEETAEALRRAGAEVELCDAGTLPARLQEAAASDENAPDAPRGPRVQLKRALAPAEPALAPLHGDEPGLAALTPLPRRAPVRRAGAPGVGVTPPRALETPSVEDSDDDDLALGSLIPAPMRAAAPASLRPPSIPVAAGAAPADAAAVDDGEALQLALASLPRVKAVAGASQAAVPAARPARPARPSPATPIVTPVGEAPRKTWLIVGGAVVLLGVALALGRAALSDDSDDVENSAPAASGEGGAEPAAEVRDAQLVAATAEYVTLDARTWLRLDELNHFGAMSAPDSRTFLDRLAAAGALTANVGLPTDSAVRAGVLVLQHSPLHRDSLLEAATAHRGGPVVSATCVQVGQRLMLIRLDGCP